MSVRLSEIGTVVAGVIPPMDVACAGVENGFRWHVLHTKSRQEKAVADLMSSLGGRVVLPVHRRVVYYGHRKRVIEAPLFSCYVFLWGLREHAFQGVASKRVAKVIAVPGQEQLAKELAQIEAAVSAGAELGPYGFLERGRRVRVTAGPFEGVEGLVEEWAKTDRLILQVHTIGRALSLEIDASLLEPTD